MSMYLISIHLIFGYLSFVYLLVYHQTIDNLLLFYRKIEMLAPEINKVIEPE